MAFRAVAHIDPLRCLGCGQCLSSCPRGILEIRSGVARLASQARCAGKGRCLGHCSADAISLVEREEDGA